MGGLTSLLLLLCVGVTLSAVLDVQKRIIGGDVCPKKERGYHVKFTTRLGAFLCGGSLLENNWILTAAHCWEKGMTAILRVHPRIQPGTEPVAVPVVITADPVIYKDGKKRIHDIMLLKLPPLPIPEIQITPVELPKDCKKKPMPGDTVQIAGHAATTKGPDNKRGCDESKELQCADIKLSDCKRLKTIMSSHELYSYNHWFCGDTQSVNPRQVDACPGDSGGGVVVGNTIYGVISFTGDLIYANTEDLGFMDVCEYKKWIKKTTKRGLFG